jgi:16S rRNA (cytosine967-C5)-methyltransferase
MAVSPARRAAYEVLLRVFEQDAYADRVFRTAARDLDERERAFAQRLSYGAVQRVRTLDHAIETLGKRPVRKLDPPVRAALRLGAYQLAYTDTAPHAAANESVELVRRARLERAVPFTNAVMRRLAAGIGDLLAALPDGALKESYPDWIADTFERDLGRAGARALMRPMTAPLEPVVRLVDGDPPSGAQPTDVPGAYRVDRVDDLAVAEGRIWPQSRGSQVAGLAVGARDGERVLDLCAAPGGKTGQLRGDVTAVEIDPNRASELRENLRTLHADRVTVVEADGTQLPPELRGEVTAVEIDPVRVRELRENLVAMGRSDVTVVEADGTALPPELAGFDRALVDAPCSGLGVLARRPDLRWRAKPLAELQLELLRAAAERVRPGGTIVYSVCTINRDENEAVVEASGLDVVPLGEEWPQFVHPRDPRFLLTLPHRDRTSGFFVARLRT